MIRKIKTYIDTSVWNFALETDRLDSSLTYEFLEMLKNSEYIPVISNVVMAEIEASSEPRKTLLLDLIDIFSPEMVIADDATTKLVQVYIDEKIVPKNSFNDAIHIATASMYRCNFLVSWNFKHIVRAKVINGTHIINLREGYGLMEIVSPREFLGK